MLKVVLCKTVKVWLQVFAASVSSQMNFVFPTAASRWTNLLTGCSCYQQELFCSIAQSRHSVLVVTSQKVAQTGVLVR